MEFNCPLLQNMANKSGGRRLTLMNGGYFGLKVGLGTSKELMKWTERKGFTMIKMCVKGCVNL